MAYEVLARKWRPHSFNDMVGQTPILRMLENALEQQRLHHAYLLTGTRGVGKTTIARIFAKCLNCEAGISANPCDKCATCQAIDNGKFLDLFEIDAASRTKVEDTRELLDNVPYPPTQGRYKVYLIDEVHMLSNHSFNALLKTLEEPPAHVKFILATTDPKRLPVTILSRCLQFHLKRITPEQIEQHLQHICQSESITFEEDALKKLAQAADGSMRDALSLLDQAIAYSHGEVKTVNVMDMLGSTSQDDVLPLLQALAAKDNQALFNASRQLSDRSPDFQQVLEEMINLLHQAAMSQLVDHADNESVKQLSQQFSPEEIQLYYQIALLGRRDLSLSPNPQQGFEMTLLRLAAFRPSEASNNISSIPASQQRKPATTTQVKTPASADNPQPAQGNLTTWQDILPNLNLTGMAYALASNSSLAKMDDSRIELLLSPSHQPMLNQKLKDRLEEAISNHLNKKIQLQINISKEPLETPASINAKENSNRLADTKKALLSDPEVRQLIDTYDASLEVTLLS